MQGLGNRLRRIGASKRQNELTLRLPEYDAGGVRHAAS